MRLRPRGLKLGADLTCENIVPYYIFLSVMLMEASGLAFIHKVVFQTDVGRTLVRIKSPSSIVQRLDVMKDIVADRRSL